MTSVAEQLEPTIIRGVIEKGIGLLERRCIRLDGRDPKWRALFSEELENITRAASPAEFEARMNAVITRGGLSHVALFHESAQRAPARYAINATFCPIDTPHGKRWLFEDVHEGGPAHTAGIRPGDVLLNANGKQVQPPELPTFALGSDTEVGIERADGSTHKFQVVLPKAEPGKAKARPPMAQPSSVVAREIKPGIG